MAFLDMIKQIKKDIKNEKKLKKLFKVLGKRAQKDTCKECDYYNSANGTCKSKSAQLGDPYVTIFDRRHCKPYRYAKETKK